MEIQEGVKINIGKMTYCRFNISAAEWELIEAHLAGQIGQHGGVAQDNQKFINAVV